MSQLNVRKSFLQRLFRSYKKQEAIIHPLSYLFWECTLRCSLNCSHCGSDCKTETRIPDMPAEDFLKILTSIKKDIQPAITTIVLTGGEPTIRKDLPDVGAKISQLGYKWGIVTNGMHYTDELHQKLMQAGMGAITISLDGLEKNHNWLRNSGLSFEMAVRAVDMIRKENHLNYDIVTCVNQRNISELEELMAFMEDRNIKAWRLFTIAPIGRAKSNKELLLDPSQLKYLMDFIQSSRKSSPVDIKFSCEAYVGHYENEVRDGFFFCRAGINIASVLADGSISACPNIDRKYIQGNIYDSEFMDVWNNGFQKMRDRSWTRKNECSNCKEFKYCQGAALHLRDSDGNLLQCHFNQINDAISVKPH